MKFGTILVTGGLGQIGSYICDRLQETNCNVIILDKRAPGDTYSRNVKIVRGDIRDQGLVSRLVKEADAIVHCADWTGRALTCPTRSRPSRRRCRRAVMSTRGRITF